MEPIVLILRQYFHCLIVITLYILDIILLACELLLINCYYYLSFKIMRKRTNFKCAILLYV